MWVFIFHFGRNLWYFCRIIEWFLQGNELFYWENVLRNECIWWHLSSIVTNCVFNQFRKKKLWIYIWLYFSFYRTFYTWNLFHCEEKLLRVRLITKELPNFNFFIQEINKCWYYTPSSARQKILWAIRLDLDAFSFLL